MMVQGGSRAHTVARLTSHSRFRYSPRYAGSFRHRCPNYARHLFNSRQIRIYFGIRGMTGASSMGCVTRRSSEASPVGG